MRRLAPLLQRAARHSATGGEDGNRRRVGRPSLRDFTRVEQRLLCAK